MYGVRGRDGGMGVVGVPGAGGTQSYRPSSTRGHSTWEPDPSRVVWQRLCKRLLAEKNYLLPCGHTNDLLHEDGGKKCKCVGGGG